MKYLKRPHAEPRATIKTVAKHAGVSVPAVSKVLRNAYGVSEALRQRVETSIRELGYRPNVAARAMRGQTFTIGVLLTGISNPFLPQIVDGMNQVLHKADYRAMIGVGQSQRSLEVSLVESMISYQMDGLLLVAPLIHGDVLAQLAEQIPMVVVANHEPHATSFDTVNSNDQEGAAIAVQQFEKMGITDIAMLSTLFDDPDHYTVMTQREIGFTKAMQCIGHGNDLRIWRVPHNAHNTMAIEALLQRPDRPRALFCWSDLDAIHVLDAAKMLGIRIPQDLAIIGYDNSSVAGLNIVDLASIDQDGFRIGSLAAETLLSRIQGRRESSHILVDPKFVARGSVGL